MASDAACRGAESDVRVADRRKTSVRCEQDGRVKLLDNPLACVPGLKLSSSESTFRPASPAGLTCRSMRFLVN